MVLVVIGEGVVMISQPGLLDRGRLEHQMLAGITEDQRHLDLLEMVDLETVELDDDEIEAQVFQNLGGIGPGLAAAGNDDMVVQSRFGDVDGLQDFMAEPFFLQGVQGCRQARQRRGQEHREDGGVEHQGVKIVVDRFAAQADAGQDEGELADLEQTEADGEGDNVAVAEKLTKVAK